MTATLSHYEVLGVRTDAGPESLRRAYRRLARRFHPDVNADPKAHDKMARLNEAFQTLIDPEERQEYDALLASGGGATRVRHTTPGEPVSVKLKARLKAHRTPVYSLSFAKDTGELIASSFDNEVVWWDLTQIKTIRRTRLEAGVVSTVAPLEGGRIAAAGATDTQLAFWQVHGQRVDSWRHMGEDWLCCVAISPDGSSLATGSVQCGLSVRQVKQGGRGFNRSGHTESITAVAWSSDSATIATGSADATIKLWHGDTGVLIRTIKAVRSTVTALAFNPTNSLLAAACADLSIRIFDLAEGTLRKIHIGHEKPIEALAFHPNGWLLASGSRDGTVGLWNASAGIGNVRLGASNRPITCVAFSGDGAYFAAGGLDRTVRLWDVKTG